MNESYDVEYEIRTGIIYARGICVCPYFTFNIAHFESSQRNAIGKETVLAALARLDHDIANSEKLHPAQRLAVVGAEIEIIRQEIQQLEEATSSTKNTDSYSKIMHQEMRRLELSWLHAREKELQQERILLHTQLLRIRSLYTQLQHLLGAIWNDTERPNTSLENDLNRAQCLRDALAKVCMRLKAAAEYAHSALRLLDEALPAWKLASIGKSGWERTQACGDACKLMVHARCQERGARRVMATPSAPRAARALRLALDYAFTDTVHDHKYQRATETFLQFREAVVQLINSIHQVLINNIENLAVAEKELEESRQKLRAARANDMLKKGLADLRYESSTLTSLKASHKIRSPD